MKKLVAIIVGGSGQFGITLSQLLLKKNYKVIITSRSRKNISSLKSNKDIKICKLDIYKKIQITKIVNKFKPSIIFYFAGQSSPKKSFISFKETYKSNVLGCKNFLDIINKKNLNCKFINAASCEMYGKIKGKIKISSKKNPVNPYGEAKLKSFEITKKFREQNNLKTYNAIIFNTESYFRNKDFLIPKICIAAITAKKYGEKTEFGNLKISREWNWCEEQCKSLLNFINKKPQDFILSNGKNFTAFKMLNFAFKYFNLNCKKFILINKKFLRKKDIQHKKSDYIKCLKRNRIKRMDKIYGKKLIIKLIKYYLNEKKYK